MDQPQSTSVSNRSKEVEKKEPPFLNLEQHRAKLHHEETERKKKERQGKEKSLLEMYREIGAVNGPGWRPKPERKSLEMGIVQSSTLEESQEQF